MLNISDKKLKMKQILPKLFQMENQADQLQKKLMDLREICTKEWSQIYHMMLSIFSQFVTLYQLKIENLQSKLAKQKQIKCVCSQNNVKVKVTAKRVDEVETSHKSKVKEFIAQENQKVLGELYNLVSKQSKFVKDRLALTDCQNMLIEDIQLKSVRTKTEQSLQFKSNRKNKGGLQQNQLRRSFEFKIEQSSKSNYIASSLKRINLKTETSIQKKSADKMRQSKFTDLRKSLLKKHENENGIYKII